MLAQAHPLRKKAWEHFQHYALPKEVSDRVALLEEGCGTLPDAPYLLPFSEAQKTYGMLIQNTWRQLLQDRTHPLALLNLAKHDEGLFISIPPNAILDDPISLSLSAAFSHIHLHVGEGASAKFIIEASGHLFIEGSLAKHSNVNLFRTQGNLDTLRFSLKKDAQLHLVSAKCGYQEIRCRLNEERAHASVHTLAETMTTIAMEHNAPRTTSDQLVKALIKGSGRSTFEGSIAISKCAQQTEARQLSRALLLSPGARAIARPLLMIEADDVKASHGATVTQLSERELFYLWARGLSRDEAQQQLIKGFCQEITNQFPKQVVL